MAPSDDPRGTALRRPWSRTGRRVPRFFVQPVQEFMHREASGGLVLACATVAALLWANLAGSSYDSAWDTHLTIGLGSFTFDESMRHVVNDGLMALFFFVIGLEVKRELAVGELRDRRALVLPFFAAIGGMLVPAGIYLAINGAGSGSEGWGVPMATDIAFALGVMALLGDRVPTSLKLLLLGLAVIDDLGAILVIALFYGDGVSLGWLAAAAVGLVAIEVGKRAHVSFLPWYVMLGLVIWFATWQSGLHATIAGVAIGLLTPARPFQPSDAVSDAARETADATIERDDDPDRDAAEWRRLSWLSRQAISPLARAEHGLHPWTSYVVLPLFALANLGVDLDPDVAVAALSGTIGLGIIAGLVLGKPLGIAIGVFVAVRTGAAQLPAAITWMHVAGMGALAGLGFTMSLFITTLAFTSDAEVAPATIAVVVASVAAAVIGASLLVVAGRRAGGDFLQVSGTSHHD